MFYHIKIKPGNGIHSITTFWLGGDSEEEIRKILMKKKYTNIEWIREETPPFI